MMNIKSFWNAINGLTHTVYTERNMKVHFFVMLVVCITAALTHCNAIEWSLLLMCFAVVISLEEMNTAIEKSCNMTTTDYNNEIRIIKDVAAGAVLFASICSALVGLIILLPKILAWI